MKRLVSIDVLRGAAILMMIQVHFVEYLSPREVSSALLYDLSKHLGVLPAPLFMFLMGLSLWLWLRGQAGVARSEQVLNRIVLRRGLTLIGIGLVFIVVIWLPDAVFDWDILTLLGTSPIILFHLRKWSTRTGWILFAAFPYVALFARNPNYIPAKVILFT